MIILETFLKFDISFFSVMLLLILFISMKIKQNIMGASNKLFQKLIWVNIYMLLMEVISWQFDKKPGQFNWYANYISNMIFAWSTPIITCIWACYIDYHIFKSFKRLKQHWYYLQPMIINTVLIIINFFNPILFSVNKDNVYSRGSYLWIIMTVNFIVVFFLWYQAYIHRHEINRNIIISILLYLIIPAIAAGIQILVYGAFVLWPTMTVTIVVTYIFLDTVSTSTDYLTGLLVRNRIDQHVDYLIEIKKTFALIIIDLNNFKSINDNFGHIYGDKALIIFAKALKKGFSKSMSIGRYGGDEFIVITNPLNQEELKEIKIYIYSLIREETNKADIPFDISFSIGYQLWDKNLNYSYDKLFSLADKKMYNEKKLSV